MGLSIRQGDVLEQRFELRERMLAHTASELWAAWDVSERSDRLLRVYRPGASLDAISREVSLSARSFAGAHAAIARIMETSESGDGLLITLIEHRAGRPLSTIPEPSPTAYRDVLRLARPIVEALLGVHEKGVEHGRVDDDHVLVAADGWVLLPPDLTVSGRRDTRQLGELIAARLTAGRAPSESARLNDTPELLHAGRTVPALLNDLIYELRAGRVGSAPVLLRDVLDRFDQLERLAGGRGAGGASGSGRSPRFVIESGGGAQRTRDGARRWPWVALAAVGGLLVVLAAIIIGWRLMPPVVENNEAAAPSERPVSVQAPAPEEPPVPEEEKEEEDPAGADAALEALLAARAEADAIGAAAWGGAAHDEAVAAATEGDDLYLAKRYEAARERYAAATQRLGEIVRDAGAVYERLLSEGEAALARVDAEGARLAFEHALLIEPESEPARIGAERAATIEAVDAHLRAGEAHERADRLPLALVEYSEALGLDPRASEAAAAHARVLGAMAAREYRDAMGRGLGAYFDGEPGSAAAIIEEAARIRPGAESQAALELAREAALRERIAELEGAARAHALEERWQEARGAYMRVLDLDPDVEFAQEGRERAETMIRLEVFAREFLAEPALLLEPETREEAGEILEEIRGVEPIGPRLRDVRERLAALVAMATTPRPVLLRSDGLTEVQVYRVGRYRPFRSLDLELLPGEYVVVGQRDGYRDVRLTVRVEMGGEPVTVRVVCTEPI